MNDDMDTMTIPGGSNFQFSAVRPEKLDASEYTLVTLALDISGSVEPFKDELLAMVRAIVNACKKHPRSENLVFRLLYFDSEVKEIHGFKLLNDIDPDNDYQPIDPRFMTALFDATYDAVGATLHYAEALLQQDLDVNGAIYIVTDGDDNHSGRDADAVGEMLRKARQNEDITSLTTILVGLNLQNPKTRKNLEEFKENACLDQFVDVGEATPQKLAKLANFVSQSISSTSQALHTKTPSATAQF